MCIIAGEMAVESGLDLADVSGAMQQKNLSPTGVGCSVQPGDTGRDSFRRVPKVRIANHLAPVCQFVFDNWSYFRCDMDSLLKYRPIC